MTRKAHTNGGDLYLLNFGTKAVMAQPSKSQGPTKEMVQAVRECVPERSNHDISLVLQYYDYDVETTIQAFVENGAVEALKDWHHAGSAKNVNKRGKKKNKAAQQTDDTSSAIATVTPVPSAQLSASGCVHDISSATVPSQQQAANGDLTMESSIDGAAAADVAVQLAQEQGASHREKQADSTLASSADDPSLLQRRGSVGGLPVTEVKSARETATVGDVAADDLHTVTRAVMDLPLHSCTTSHDNTRLSRNTPPTVAGKSGSNRLPSAAPATSADAFRGTSNAGAGRHVTSGHGAGHTAGPVQHVQHAVPAAHSKPHAGLEKSVKDLHRQSVSLAHLQLHFNDECDKSLKKIKAVFEQLRSGLNDREADLMYQLDKAKDAGGEIFTSRLNKALELKMSCDRCPGALVHAAQGSEAAHVAEQQLADLRTDIKHFVSERKVDEELSRAAHFIVSDTDITDLLATIQNFGEVVPVRNGYSSARRLSSSSACSGTDGDDAGARTQRRQQQQQQPQQHSQLSASGTTANGRLAAAAISDLVSVKSRTAARSLTGSADSGAGRQSAAASDVAVPSGTVVAEASTAAASATLAAGPRAKAAAGEDKRNRAAAAGAAAPYDAQRLAASVQLPQPQISTGSTSVSSPSNDKDVARTGRTLAANAAAPVTSGGAQVGAVLQQIEAAASSVSSSTAGTTTSTAAAPRLTAAREPAVSEQRQLPKSERLPSELVHEEVHNQQPPCRDWSEEVVEPDAKPESHGMSNGYRRAYNDSSSRAGSSRYRESNQHDVRMHRGHRSRPHDGDQRHSLNGHDGYRNSSRGMESRVYRRSPSGSNGSYYAEPRSSIDSQRWQQQKQQQQQQQQPSQTDAHRAAGGRAEPVSAAAAEPSVRLDSAATSTGNFRQGPQMAPQEAGAGTALVGQTPSISSSRSELRESNGSARSSVRRSEGDSGSGYRGGRNRGGGRQGHGPGSIPAGSGDPIATSRRFASRRDEQPVPSSPAASDAGAAVASVGGVVLSGGDIGDKTGADSSINAAALVAPERVKSDGRGGGYRSGRGRGAAPAGDRSVPGVAGGGSGRIASDALPQRQPRHWRGRHGGPPRTSATHPTNEDAAGGSVKNADAFDRPGSSFSVTTAAAAATTTEAAAAATVAVGHVGAQE